MNPHVKMALGAFLLQALCWSGPALAQGLSLSSPIPNSPGIANPLAGIATSKMSAFLDRPLFSPSRRPPQPTTSVNAGPPPPPVISTPTADHLRLVGTLTSDAGGQAIIQSKAGGTLVSVTEGELVDAWRVIEIQPSLVRLTNGSNEVVLEMFKAGRTSAPPAVSATAAPIAPPTPIEPSSALSASTPGGAPGTAPPQGTQPGTAAAAIAAQSPFRLTFGSPPSTSKP